MVHIKKIFKKEKEKHQPGIRVGPFESVDLSSRATSVIYSSVTCHLTCLCHSFHMVNGGRWRTPHGAVRGDYVRHWRVPGTRSAIKASWFPFLSNLPLLRHVLCCGRSLANLRDYGEDWEEKFQVETVSGTSRRRWGALFIRLILHMKESCLELVPKFGCAGLGPGNKIEAVDNFPSPDLRCCFEIYPKFQRKDSISKRYDF